MDGFGNSVKKVVKYVIPAVGALSKYKSPISNIALKASQKLTSITNIIAPALKVTTTACSIYENPSIQPYVDMQLHKVDCGHPPDIVIALQDIDFNSVLG